MTEYNKYTNMKILGKTPQNFIDFCINLWGKPIKMETDCTGSSIQFTSEKIK